MAWLYLLLAGCLELGFTTCFKLSANFTNWRWTIAFLVCATLSVYCFNQAIKSIPLGTAYVVWTGIGAAGTVLIGMLWFHEPATGLRLFFIATLLGSILGLKLVTN